MNKGKPISRKKIYELFQDGKLTFINKEDIPVVKVDDDDKD